MGNHDKCLTFVRNLHSNHVYIRGPSGNIMAAIFHKSRKRFTKKKKRKRRTQTKVMKDAMKTRKLTPRPKIFVVKTIHHLVAMVTYKYRLVAIYTPRVQTLRLYEILNGILA